LPSFLRKEYNLPEGVDYEQRKQISRAADHYGQAADRNSNGYPLFGGFRQREMFA